MVSLFTPHSLDSTVSVFVSLYLSTNLSLAFCLFFYCFSFFLNLFHLFSNYFNKIFCIICFFFTFTQGRGESRVVFCSDASDGRGVFFFSDSLTLTVFATYFVLYLLCLNGYFQVFLKSYLNFQRFARFIRLRDCHFCNFFLLTSITLLLFCGGKASLLCTSFLFLDSCYTLTTIFFLL